MYLKKYNELKGGGKIAKRETERKVCGLILL